MISKERWSSIKKVLVIRSCQMYQFYKDIGILKDYLQPEAIIDVLAQPEVKAELEAQEDINEVLIYDKGFFKVKDISKDLWDKIQSNYDAFIILYNNPGWKAYHQINKIAALCRAKYICGIDNEENMFLVSSKLWWLKRLYTFISKIVIYVILIPFIPLILILLILFAATWLLWKGIIWKGITRIITKIRGPSFL